MPFLASPSNMEIAAHFGIPLKHGDRMPVLTYPSNMEIACPSSHFSQTWRLHARPNIPLKHEDRMPFLTSCTFYVTATQLSTTSGHTNQNLAPSPAPHLPQTWGSHALPNILQFLRYCHATLNGIWTYKPKPCTLACAASPSNMEIACPS